MSRVVALRCVALRWVASRALLCAHEGEDGRDGRDARIVDTDAHVQGHAHPQDVKLCGVRRRSVLCEARLSLEVEEDRRYEAHELRVEEEDELEERERDKEGRC